MADNKDPEPKVEFSDTKALHAKRSSRRTKIAVIGVLALVLFLGAVVSVASYFILRKTTPTRLAEVNLEEGETLTYRVDQDIEIQRGRVQKNTIHVIASFRVLNKTSDEYWFLTKINITVAGGNVNLQGLNQKAKGHTEYFLVRLQISPSQSTEQFELYGNRQTEAEFVHYVYGILDQLLPALKRDLYEDVDGQKLLSQPDPEKSPVLPGDVKVHRKANTSDKHVVFITKSFNRKDLLNVSSEIDVDVEYSDFAFINKSNGMVTESRAYLSEQLNFGEPIHTKDGFDITSMKINLFSRVSLIDQTNSFYFGKKESEAITFHLFVKLVVPKSTAVVNDDPDDEFPSISTPSNSGQMSPNNSSHYDELHNSTDFRNSSSLSTKRQYRRAAGDVEEAWSRASQLPSLNKKFKVFKKKVVGINVQGEGRASMNPYSQKVEVGFYIKIGSGGWKKIYSDSFQGRDLTSGEVVKREYTWGKTFSVGFSVFVLWLGVDFNLDVSVGVTLSFPPELISVNPPRIGLKIEPSADVTTTIDGYASIWIARGGIEGSGTLVALSLPATLTYKEEKWCLDVYCDLTALKLSARIFYQTRYWSWSSWSFKWGDKKTILQFGTWSAIKKKWEIFGKCPI